MFAVANGWSLLLDLAAILAAAFVFGALLERFRQSAVLGYILAGVILGPGATHVVQSADSVRGIAQIGVALLLFTVGLEFSWQRLRRLGAVALGGGTVQILATIAVTIGFCAAFHVGWREGFVLGTIIALSSTSIVVRVLKERVELDSAYGKNAAGILLLQDIALAPLLLAVTFLGRSHAEPVTFAGVSLTVVKVIVACVLFLAVFSKALPRALGSRAMIRNRELPILLAVIACIGSAWGAQSIGISSSLGAFLAGMLLAETPYAEQIRADIGALRTLFATIFFASIGMLADARWIGTHLPMVAAVAFVMVAGKAVVAYASLRVFRQTIMISLASAIAIAQVGEFSFVLIQIARQQGVFDETAAQLATSGAVVSLILAPWLVWKAPKVARRLATRLVRRSKLIEDVRRQGQAKMKGHVILVGFGETGQAAARPLVEAGYKLFVLDLDHRLVRLANAKGHVARVGDASMDEILEGAGVAVARAIVISVPDHRLAKIIISHVKKLSPGIFVAARARYRDFIQELIAGGADCAVDESLLTGSKLGDGVLRFTRDPDDEPFA
jgi:CPA2 family monovalent cation:H+ antiporter-2